MKKETTKSAIETTSAQEIAAVFVSPDDVHPWSGNPRDNADAIKQVARSIRRFGFGAPIVARKENGEIIAGHTRWAAAKRLRLDKVPVRYLDISESEAHVLALADNKLGEIATWNSEKLSKALAELQADEAELEIGTGFDESAIDSLIGNIVDDELGDQNFQPSTSDAQGALDVKKPIMCPSCKHEFTP